MLYRCRLVALAAAALACGPALGADATVPHEPAGVVTLASQATVEVPRDWMSVTFSVSRDGADANAVQAGVKESLDAALKLAQAARRPDGQLEVRTGGFSLQPRYGQKGTMTGWSGNAELNVQGRDMAGIAALAGRISTMTIARVDYSISREARDKVEADLAGDAIAGFRAKAHAYAKAFGYGGFTIREVNVQTELPARPPVPMFARVNAVSQGAAEPLPVEAGTGSVTATVNGSIQLAP